MTEGAGIEERGDGTSPEDTVVPTSDGTPLAGRGVEPVSDWLVIGNEFTSVRIRVVRTRNGHRFEVESRTLGTRVLLDPLEVESLTWQPPETFSRLLEHPYGPEDGVTSQPLSRLLGDAAETRFDD